MPTPSIQTLTTDAQQVLNLDSISAVRSVVAVALANANTGTPLNPNLTTQQLWDQFYQVVTRPKSDIESIIANQLMKFLYAPPAPGGVGADGQVIFNDGGVLAGAANLYWNKVQQRLGLGTNTPNYTLDVVGSSYFTGAATITGDLTVDTSTLKVDSANNRVGIGTATPYSTAESLNARTTALTSGSAFQTMPLTVTDSTAYAVGVGGGINFRAKLDPTTYENYAAIWSYRESPNNSDYRGSLIIGTSDNTYGYPIERYRIASDGVATWSNVGGVAGTAMTLNSTGLIRGASSADIISAESTTLTNIGNIGASYGATTGTYFVAKVGAANGIVELKADARSGAFPPMVFTTGSTERMRIDSSGNVGIGVTPSASWFTGARVLQFGATGAIVNNGLNNSIFSNNAVIGNSGSTYIGSSAASYYAQTTGAHIFNTAGSGTAGNAITWTERLRIKETGQLRFVPLAADPTGAEAGDVYYNSTSNKLKCYNGTTWNDLF